jgi:hypothetical protein
MIRMITDDGQHTSAYWRARAEELRSRAEVMRDSDARTAMTIVADMYDRMAVRAEEREAKVTILTLH